MALPGWRAALVLAASAGCYAPSAATGGPCSASLECPSGQMCDVNAAAGPTCIAGPSLGGPPPPPPPPREVVDVSAGGTFTFDATGAGDAFDAPCAAAGGPEVYFRIALAAPEVVYLDTVGSSGEAAIAIRRGGCAELGEAEACASRTCGAEAQGAWRLPAGEHCIVVDHAGVPAGPGRLTVRRTGRAGDPLPARAGTVSGDTCQDDNSNDAECGCEPAKDHHYFFTVCPGTTVTARLETCGAASWDTVLELRAADDDSLGCNDDACDLQSRVSRQLTGPGLFWAIVDGCDECGAYTMTYSF